MPVKMVAERRHYHKAKGVELEKGAAFTVDSEQEADRLVRMRRAARVGQPKAKAEEPVTAPQQEVQQQFRTANMKAEEPSDDASVTPRRYRRRDLTPEE